MEQGDIYSILFVEIDISSREYVVCFLRFGVQQPLKTFSVPNNQPGAQALALSIENFILEQQNHKDALSRVVVALESTSYYGIHIANYLSSCEELLPFKTLVDCLKVLYEPLTVAIAFSFNLITAYNQELKAINAAIGKSIKGLDLNSYTALQSIPDIGPVFAAGILSEIGNIHSFKDNGDVVKYIGLVWRESQSGNFKAEDTSMSKVGNTYLRYYLLEATNSVIRHEASFM